MKKIGDEVIELDSLEQNEPKKLPGSIPRLYSDLEDNKQIYYLVLRGFDPYEVSKEKTDQIIANILARESGVSDEWWKKLSLAE